MCVCEIESERVRESERDTEEREREGERDKKRKSVCVREKMESGFALELSSKEKTFSRNVKDVHQTGGTLGPSPIIMCRGCLRATRSK